MTTAFQTDTFQNDTFQVGEYQQIDPYTITTHLDCHYTYNGTPKTVIDGLWHLNGVAVGVIADNVYITGHTVSNGKITLTTAASLVHVGQVYTGYIKTLRANESFNEGHSSGLVRRVVSIIARVYNSGKFKFGPNELGDSDGDPDYLDEASWVDTDPAEDIIIHTGDAVDSGFPGRYDRSGHIVIYQDKPFPVIINSITQEVMYGTKPK